MSVTVASGNAGRGRVDAGTVLAALADPTRRDVLTAVAARAGTATATELAAELPVTRQAITKHLTVLADAGLVTSVRHGREARYRWSPAHSVPPRTGSPAPRPAGAGASTASSSTSPTAERRSPLDALTPRLAIRLHRRSPHDLHGDVPDDLL